MRLGVARAGARCCAVMARHTAGFGEGDFGCLLPGHVVIPGEVPDGSLSYHTTGLDLGIVVEIVRRNWDPSSPHYVP